jgi:hypothetical protein
VAPSGRFAFANIRSAGAGHAGRNIHHREGLGTCEFNECNAVKQSKARRQAVRALRGREGLLEACKGLVRGQVPSSARLAHRKSTPTALWDNIESLGSTAALALIESSQTS